MSIMPVYFASARFRNIIRNHKSLTGAIRCRSCTAMLLRVFSQVEEPSPEMVEEVFFAYARLFHEKRVVWGLFSHHGHHDGHFDADAKDELGASLYGKHDSRWRSLMGFSPPCQKCSHSMSSHFVLFHRDMVRDDLRVSGVCDECGLESECLTITPSTEGVNHA